MDYRNRDAGLPGHPTQFAPQPKPQGPAIGVLERYHYDPTAGQPINDGRMQPGGYVKTAPSTWYGVVFEDDVNIDTGLTDEQFSDLQNAYLDTVYRRDAVLYNDWLTDDEIIDGVSFTTADFDDDARERAVRDLHSFISRNRTLIDTAVREYQQAGIVDPVQRIGADFWNARNRDGGFEERYELSDSTREALTEAAEWFGELESQPRGRNLTFVD